MSQVYGQGIVRVIKYLRFTRDYGLYYIRYPTVLEGYVVMMPFSTGTGLERVGIAGPVHWIWALDSSTKTRNKKDRRGLARCLSDA